MEFVLLSVLCSVTVSVILKLARRYGVDIRQLIVWSYPLATGLTWWFFRPSFGAILDPTLPWWIYLGLAFLLPGVFFALGGSIRYTGIVRTEVAQRLSLIIPLLAAFAVFGESVTPTRLLGLGIGLLAILCIIGRQGGGSGSSGKPRAGRATGAWLYPLVVFFGYGLCDVLFKAIAQDLSVPYTTSLFVVFLLATFVAMAYLVWQTSAGGQRASRKAVFWGLLIGAFNFGNILLYMKAHRALPENPSIVFTGMNIGVITLGALVGVVLFKEKLTALNTIGLMLALLAVVLLAWDIYGWAW